MNERDLSDEALGRRLAGELPRYAAPARLRVAIGDARPAPRRAVPWLLPALSALATAMLLVLAFVPLLPERRAADPVQRLVRSAVGEQTRTALWGPRAATPIPDALPRLAQESGITLARVFAGDEKLALVAAEPVFLEQRRGLALHRDDAGRMLTYVVLPAPGFAVPDRERVQVDRFKPALVRDRDFSAWVWKEGELACLLVAKMDAEQDLGNLKDYFVRVRVGTQPVLAN